MNGKRLNQGDTIGIISPSSPLEISEIENGIRFFNELGYDILEGEHIYEKYGYLAGRDFDRAQDLNNMTYNCITFNTKAKQLTFK